MYESVIFDFDGTLVDSAPVIDHMLHFFASRYKMRPMGRTQFEALRDLPLRDMIKEVGLPLYKLPRLAHQARREYANHIDLLRPMPQIGKILDDLSSQPVRLFILSSNATDNIRRYLHLHDLDCFEDVQSAPNLMRKDKGIQQLIRKHHISVSRALYIGDELRDIQACQKISLDVAAVTWGHDSKMLLATGEPTYLIDEPTKLLQLITGAKTQTVYSEA